MNRLIKIQSALKAPKNQHNNYGGYYYRSCEDILEALKPFLKEFNLALIINDEIVQLGDRYYIKATASLYDEDKKEIASSTGFAREAITKKGMDESQITGATSSYARKYALNGLFMIDDAKDADFTNKHGKEEQNNKKEEQKIQDGSKCPKCGGKITQQALEKWGCCASCKAKENKNNG